MPHDPGALHRIEPGSKVDLRSIDPSKTPGLSGSRAEERAAAEAAHAENIKAMRDLQYKLWAEQKQSLLVVLQGMDTSGKDGTIRHVFGALNPQGVRVQGFKRPTPEELRHDFLWRVHKFAPAAGGIVVFNRSHYEDVLAVRVLKLVHEDLWRLRYDHINDFERLLGESGTAVVKIMLHISKNEQKERLQARLDEPDKRWKFEMGDLETRKRWGDYRAAYEEAIERCNTAEAPWHIVPADRKWYRNWVISSIVRARLEAMDPKTPPADPQLDHVTIDD
ncbi:MAG: PPK2 family polyphosphate kinase [Planctomycetota bacterium]